MNLKKLSVINLILAIIAIVLLLILSLLSVLAFSIVLSFTAIAGKTLPNWLPIIVLFNCLLAIIILVGEILSFKRKKAGKIILLVSTVLTLILPIAFFAILGFSISSLGFFILLLIPTIILIFVTILAFKIDKMNNNLEKENV